MSRRRRRESALDIQFYIDTETADNIARGMSPEDARTAALRKFGNPALIQEDIYRMGAAGILENIMQDLRYALRALRRNPAFAVTAILTLALGIGANTAVFTVIRTVLLKPLEYRDPDRLVRLTLDFARRNQHDVSFSPMQFEGWGPAQSFDGIGAYTVTTEDFTLSGGGDPEAIKGARVTGNFLQILGVDPILGRSFLSMEDSPAGPPVALISTELWKRRYSSDPAIAGKTTVLDSTSYSILGVLPAGFSFPFPGVDVWVPRPAEWSAIPRLQRPSTGSLVAFGRLKPGVTVEQARVELQVLNRRYIASHPGLRDSDPNSTVRIVRLQDHLVSNVRLMLWTLFGAVAFVLLITCANVASLLLARAASRSREFAVRAALGASRSRLIGQLLAESLLLALAGGAFALLLARWGLSAIAQLSALNLPRAGEIHLDGFVLGFTVLITIATGVLFGLFPSLEASRPDLADVLRDRAEGSGQHSARRGAFSTRGSLVITQIALSVILLIGAGLLMRSFDRLHDVNPGFQSTNLLTMKIALPPARYDTGMKQFVFFRELVRRLKSIPGVRDAAVAATLPLSAHYFVPIQVAEQPLVKVTDRFQVEMQNVTPGYFHTLGIPIRRGRDFVERDDVMDAPAAVVINESLARRFWPAYPAGPDPVGQHILVGAAQSGGLEIAGVAADMRDGNLASSALPELFLPSRLRPQKTGGVMVRTVGDPVRFVPAIRSELRALDSDQPILDLRTMDQVLENSVGQRRLTVWLLGGFAALALLLAMLGIYGVVAYSVVQRTAEVGIRRALGAQERDILRLVIGKGLTLALIGIVIGTAGALALTRLMKGLLFQISATDPWTFAAMALLFVIVALVASYVPARRAIHIDPMAALR